jgi:hypothetical protein
LNAKLKPILENTALVAGFAVGAYLLYHFATSAIAAQQSNAANTAYNNAIANYDNVLAQQQESSYILGSLGLETNPTVQGSTSTNTLSAGTVTPPVIAPVSGVTLGGTA